MTETHRKPHPGPPERFDPGEPDASVAPEDGALPAHVAGSGTLDRLVETARDYARAAASENTLKAYAKDWAAFARWCRMRGADHLARWLDRMETALLTMMRHLGNIEA